MSSRIVVPDVAVLPLTEGDTITVKQRLSSGEERRMIRRGVSYTADGTRQFDPLEAGVAKILAYLVDWTFRGLDGRIIPIRDQAPAVVESALDLLDPESYSEVLRAIEAHERAMQEQRDAQKKIPTGGPTLVAISPSRAAVAGDTSGS
jgi:hypothetical protein